MVVHIVMFKFKRDCTESMKKKAKDAIDVLPKYVPSLKSIETGMNFADEERAMDMSLIAKFDDKKGLEEYAINKEHQKVIALLKTLCEYTKVVDYEITEA